MTKSCPKCYGPAMILFDATGLSPDYSPLAGINWEEWPFVGDPKPDTWVCPGCGHWEGIGLDVEAQQENRPRLF